MTDAEAYLPKLRSFISTQDYLSEIGLDTLTLTTKRVDLCISSLAVIMLVANYMETKGLSSSTFKPEWIAKLDAIEGIVSVFREIDSDLGQLG